jgi:hypothetical protein
MPFGCESLRVLDGHCDLSRQQVAKVAGILIEFALVDNRVQTEGTEDAIAPDHRHYKNGLDTER